MVVVRQRLSSLTVSHDMRLTTNSLIVVQRNRGYPRKEGVKEHAKVGKQRIWIRKESRDSNQLVDLKLFLRVMSINRERTTIRTYQEI